MHFLAVDPGHAAEFALEFLVLDEHETLGAQFVLVDPLDEWLWQA
jgi:hypothetical protein